MSAISPHYRTVNYLLQSRSFGIDEQAKRLKLLMAFVGKVSSPECLKAAANG